MSFGFKDVKPGTDKNYLKEASCHVNAKLLGLSYDATEEYEYLDIEIETADGRYFRERTFGPNKEKVFPKNLYKGGGIVGVETKQQAYERVQQEINTKLFHLASCFVDRKTLTDEVSSVTTFKELVEAVKKVIGEPSTTINFLTIWKNNDGKQKSNLIIAEKSKWCEPYVEGKNPSITYSKWQMTNQMVEKYPYQGATGSTLEGTESLVNEGPAGEVSDLPF